MKFLKYMLIAVPVAAILWFSFHAIADSFASGWWAGILSGALCSIIAKEMDV